MIFSNSDVIRRVNADFVPVALKAGLIDNPPDNDEGRLYREIGRSKILPQGVCVVNSAGKVLDWVFMFDDDKAVLDFLDHAKKRFAEFPDATKPFAAERFKGFPSQKLANVDDSGKVMPMVDRHREGESCPAKPRVPQGTLLARVFGRALDKDGKPAADTVRQENYLEDRFHVPVVRQEGLAKALAAAGTNRFKIDDDLARVFISHAFMGELDLNPLGDLNGSKCEHMDCAFSGQKIVAVGNGPVWVRIDGESEVAGVAGQGQDDHGALWQHRVKLSWAGLIEMNGNRMTRLLLLARGTEKLTRGNKKEESSRLRGRRAVFIDLDNGVRYGIIGQPVAVEETSSGHQAQVPDEARKMLRHEFGGPFVVSRDAVQVELQLTNEQKEKLNQNLLEFLPDAVQFFRKMERVSGDEREQQFAAYRRKARKNLAALLNETLNKSQRTRLRQLELQREGLRDGEIWELLHLEEDQRKQFMGLIMQAHQKIQPLLKEAQKTGNLREVQGKVIKVRDDLEADLRAKLTDDQKSQWKEMLGKPMDPAALFDL